MTETPDREPAPPASPSEYRWQALFQRGTEPLFLLDRFRRVRFVNRAWEILTGLSASQARGLLCTRYKSAHSVARALCPPPEVLAGKAGRVRRLFPGTQSGPPWWDVDFFPLIGPKGLLGVLGKITVAIPTHTAGARSLPEELGALRDRAGQRFGLERLASTLPALKRVADQVRLAGETRVPVLLVGEAGTGKRWVARAIHHHGATREGPFVPVDCPRLPAVALAHLLPSTGATSGTLYMIEPAALPQELQGRLTEWVSGGTDGPRLITATRSASTPGQHAGPLADELHTTLGTLVITLPSLRERLADLAALVDWMLERANAVHDGHVLGLTLEASELMRAYSWPGNLRELYAVLCSACGRATGERIDAADLPAYLRQTVTLDRIGGAQPERPLPLKDLLTEVERRLVSHALRTTRGNKSRAAELLGIWRPYLLRRIEALGLSE